MLTTMQRVIAVWLLAAACGLWGAVVYFDAQLATIGLLLCATFYALWGTAEVVWAWFRMEDE